METKSMGNTSAQDVKETTSDVKFFGDGDQWKLLGKAWSEEQEWMKSTKAMEIEGLGCLVQVSTQNEEMVAEALEFVPGVKIIEESDPSGNVIARRLVRM